MRKPKIRGFEYNPRYYDPSKDETLRRRRKITFNRYRRRGTNKSLIMIVIGLVLLLIVYLSMN